MCDHIYVLIYVIVSVQALTSGMCQLILSFPLVLTALVEGFHGVGLFLCEKKK